MKPQPAHCLHPADMLTSHPSFNNNFQRYLLKSPRRVSPSTHPRPRLLERSVLTPGFHFLSSHSPAGFLHLESCTHSSSEIVICRLISPSSSWGRTQSQLHDSPSSFLLISERHPVLVAWLFHVHGPDLHCSPPTPPHPQAPARTQTWCKPETWASRHL